jgi:hypothetical protein
VNRRRRATAAIAVLLGLGVVGGGAASAAVWVGDEEAIEPTLSTEITLQTGSTDSTETTLLPDWDTALSQSTEAETFGQLISTLRHSGDHTPAALIMGKKVPGWDPDKHPNATTDTIVAATPGSETGDALGDDGDDDQGDGQDEYEEEELGPNGSSGDSGDKDHVPAAVLKGKKVPGWSE